MSPAQNSQVKSSLELRQLNVSQIDVSKFSINIPEFRTNKSKANGLTRGQHSWQLETLDIDEFPGD